MSQSVLNHCVCGSKKRRLIEGLNSVNQNIYYVRCPNCGRETVPARIREEAIHKWNALTTTAPPPKEEK